VSQHHDRNADLYLADLLSQEIAKTSSEDLLAEVAEDFGDRRALARDFDAAFTRAKAQTRSARIWGALAEVLSPLWSLPLARAAMAAALILVAAGGALYLLTRSSGPQQVATMAKPSYWRLPPDSAAPVQDAELDALKTDLNQVRRAGDRAKTLELAKRYLVLAQARYGDDNPRYASRLNDIATLYQDMDRYDEAVRLYDRALAIYDRAPPSEQLNAAPVLANLASLYGSEGRYADAVQLMKRSLAIREAAQGRGSADVAAGLADLGLLYQSQGSLDAAEASYLGAVTIAEKTLGPDHPDVAAFIDRLAGAYQSQGRYAEAEPLLMRSLTIAEKALGPDRPGVTKALKLLATHYEAQGRYADARAWYEKAAAAGDAAAMAKVGNLYETGQGVPQDYAYARAWYEKAAAGGNTVAMAKIGGLYLKGEGVTRDLASARAWYEKAWAAGERSALGQFSWHALFAREFAQSLDAADRALKADPDLLWIATNRAHALMYLGRAAEARDVYLMHRDKRLVQDDNKTWQEVIEEDFGVLRLAGLDHPQMAEIEAELGIVRSRMLFSLDAPGMAGSARVLAVLPGHEGEVESCAFSPDGRYLATASAGTVRVWSVRSKFAAFKFYGYVPPITALTFGPNNVEIFTASGASVVKYRDSPEVQMTFLPPFQSKVLSLASTPEGLYVITAADDNDVALVRDDKLIRTFRGHKGPVRSATLSPDRKLILTMADDNTMRVWNAATGKQIAVLGDRAGNIAQAALSPDGRFVFTLAT
jgi:TPR repeat protein